MILWSKEVDSPHRKDSVESVLYPGANLDIQFGNKCQCVMAHDLRNMGELGIHDLPRFHHPSLSLRRSKNHRNKLHCSYTQLLCDIHTQASLRLGTFPIIHRSLAPALMSEPALRVGLILWSLLNL